jgi:hypothetical protein
MCYLNDDLSKGPFKAKEDVECWKIMDIYDGELYSAVMPAGPYLIGDTIKCAERITRFNWLNARLLNLKVFFTSEVVHAYKTKPSLPRWSWRVIVKCIIPKGTYYWYSDDQIVATKMKIITLAPYQ